MYVLILMSLFEWNSRYIDIPTCLHSFLSQTWFIIVSVKWGSLNETGLRAEVASGCTFVFSMLWHSKLYQHVKTPLKHRRQMTSYFDVTVIQVSWTPLTVSPILVTSLSHHAMSCQGQGHVMTHGHGAGSAGCEFDVCRQVSLLNFWFRFSWPDRSTCCITGRRQI